MGASNLEDSNSIPFFGIADGLFVERHYLSSVCPQPEVDSEFYWLQGCASHVLLSKGPDFLLKRTSCMPVVDSFKFVGRNGPTFALWRTCLRSWSFDFQKAGPTYGQKLNRLNPDGHHLNGHEDDGRLRSCRGKKVGQTPATRSAWRTVKPWMYATGHCTRIPTCRPQVRGFARL